MTEKDKVIEAYNVWQDNKKSLLAEYEQKYLECEDAKSVLALNEWRDKQAELYYQEFIEKMNNIAIEGN